MKRNGVPYQLDLMCRNATSFQQCARRVGSIELEARLRGVAVGQSQIVQDRRDRQKLGILSGVAYSFWSTALGLRGSRSPYFARSCPRALSQFSRW